MNGVDPSGKFIWFLIGAVIFGGLLLINSEQPEGEAVLGRDGFPGPRGRYPGRLPDFVTPMAAAMLSSPFIYAGLGELATDSAAADALVANSVARTATPIVGEVAGAVLTKTLGQMVPKALRNLAEAAFDNPAALNNMTAAEREAAAQGYTEISKVTGGSQAQLTALYNLERAKYLRGEIPTIQPNATLFGIEKGLLIPKTPLLPLGPGE